MGALAGLVGVGVHAAVEPSPLAVGIFVVLSCVGALALELGIARLRLPTTRRQVNEDWLPRYRSWVYGLGFGFQLGLGVVTIVTTAAIYLAVVLAAAGAAASGTVATGIAVGATFGLVRALPILRVARVRDPGSLGDVLRRVAERRVLAARATQVALAVSLLASLAVVVV